MDENDGLKPGTYKDFAAITPERWKELNEWAAESEERMEKVNLVPTSKEGEVYIWDRYPVFALFTRYQLQEMADDQFNTALTEKEMREVHCAFIEDSWMEIEQALIEAVKTVVSNRE